MEPHRLPVRIYYEDTDFSGVVYHASYLRFLERGRTELLRERGISQARLLAADTGGRIGFAVVRMTIEFRKPARMDDLVTVETGVKDVRGASLALEQRILRGDDVLTEAEVTVAALSDGRACRLPATLADKLRG